MALKGTKVRAAEWLYRWNLSLSILGIVFTVLTFLGVFTLVLGPVFARVGLTYLETALLLLSLVLVMVFAFGVFLDKTIKFWRAQATVATTRNPFLVAALYQKELLVLKHVQMPQLTALLAVADGLPDGPDKERLEAYLRSSLQRLEEVVRNKEWTIEPGERTY